MTDSITSFIAVQIVVVLVLAVVHQVIRRPPHAAGHLGVASDLKGVALWEKRLFLPLLLSYTGLLLFESDPDIGVILNLTSGLLRAAESVSRGRRKQAIAETELPGLDCDYSWLTIVLISSRDPELPNSVGLADHRIEELRRLYPGVHIICSTS